MNRGCSWLACLLGVRLGFSLIVFPSKCWVALSPMGLNQLEKDTVTPDDASSHNFPHL